LNEGGGGGEKDYDNTSPTITEIQNTDPIATMLMQFRIHIHSMLDEEIGLNAKLSKQGHHIS
jgi:hypothetical protein